MSDEHKDDVFKEYSAWKTPGKPSGRCKEGHAILRVECSI
jgi:hypothetical protein